jgi:hypothetical protein
MNRAAIRTLLSLLVAAALQGCAGDPALSDRLVENSGAEGFLDRIQKNCGHLSIGNQTLAYVLEPGSDDTYFVDESSKLYFGRVDRGTYATDIDAFYPTDTNKPAVACIFAQLPDQPPAQ